MAVSFVQGQLQHRSLTVTIHTACAHCGQPFRVTVDNEMRATVDEATAKPLIFEPQMDWQTFREPNIIHAY